MKTKLLKKLSLFILIISIFVPRAYSGDAGNIAITVTIPPAEITGRHIFYNGSAFGETIAPDKKPLFAGQKATFVNYTSYSGGINGIMIDIKYASKPGNIDQEDFALKVGNEDNTANWTNAPAPPTSITVTELSDTTHRIKLIWADNAIMKEWLQIKVLATENTGLTQENTFYFGNAIGECGYPPTDAKVNAFDMLGARDNQRTFRDPAPIDFRYDYNRDERVNATDMLIARNNTTHFRNALRLITPQE